MKQTFEPVINVLVVDDEEYIRELLKSFFEQKGMLVYIAADAEEALANSSLEQVHVALLDIQLPGQNGHVLQQELNRRYPDMAKILMSGQADLDDVISGFSDQAFSFIQKPFSSLKEIAVLVKRAAQNKQLEIQNREYARRLEESNKALAEQLSGRTEEIQLRQILSHLYRATPQIGIAESAAKLLELICRCLVDAGVCERAAIVVGDDKYRVSLTGNWPQGENSESLSSMVGQPLRPFDFDRVEEQIGSAVHVRPSDRPPAGHRLMVPFARQDDSVLGYLSVASPPEVVKPSIELVQLIDVMLAQGAQQLEALQLREELQKRAAEFESRASSAEGELGMTESRFNRLVDASIDIVYVTDEQDRLTFLNESFTRTLGYVRENYLGRTLRHLLEELSTENPMNRRAIQDLSSQDSIQSVHHVEVLTRQGDKRTLEIHRSVLRQGAEFKGTQGIARDITEQRALLQQLVASERLATTGRIAAGVAHEIKNPLQAMLSQLQAVEQKLNAQEDPSENLGLIQEGIERLRSIVGGMLDLNRTSTAARLPVDMNILIEKVITLVQQQIRERNVSVQLNLDPALPHVAGSSQELQQVLLNLILNALEAMPGGGELRISSALVNERVEIAVEDSGVGIAPENIKQIFDPFFTVRVSGTGTGLGLYLTKNIVEMHQGSIAVESEPAKGARFTITLPRA